MDGSSNRRVDDAVAEARAAFVAALADGDAEATASAYTEDARLLAPSAELIEGREAIGRFWQEGVRSGLADVQLDVLKLERSADVAYEIGRYILRLEPAEGKTVADRGKYVVIHRRKGDGTWLRAVEMFNADASSGVALARAPAR